MSQMYTCTKKHRTNKVQVNYITKKQECGRHYCNAPIVSVETVNSDGKVVSVTIFWTEVQVKR
jgi:hypothetical protein